MLHRHAISRCRAPASRTDAFDHEIHGRATGFFEFQSGLDMFAFLERLLQADKHNVISGGFESNCLARLDFNARCDLAHLHHTLVHTHFMNFEFARNVRNTAEQPIGSASGIGDRKVAATYRSPFWRGARPSSRQFESANHDIVGARGPGGTDCKDEGGNERNFTHLDLRTTIPNQTYTGTCQASMVRSLVE